MMRGLGTGRLGAGVLCIAAGSALTGAALPARSAPAGLEAAAWAITPEDAACHTELELVSRSGAVAPVILISDGQRVALRFTKQSTPAQAFLPIRIDQKPFSNLVQRTGEEGLAIMTLSDETLAALRHGKTLQIAWLSDEGVSASLFGAGQGIADLKTCGAQVAGQHRAQMAEIDAQRARAEADARTRAMADEQLATARAQTAAAEAQRQKVAAEAQRASAEAQALAVQARQQQAALDDRQRQIAEENRQRQVAAQQQYYYDRAPPPEPASPYGYYRPYYPR